MRYVDGFVIPVPEQNLANYRSIAQKAGKIWKEHGALEYVEAVGDDLENQMGASFGKTIKLKPGETALFSFIVYRSRADRDKVNAKVMSDPRMKKIMESSTMPFEIKRMVYGGFKTIVDL
ncbi:MAG TPA: DUF1428 domain-containing protein [Pyrinomonadaceae bacterium]|jgi:uncharacterized protein YbaA (DUF1428 family)|nr:DUF1428 domain-containing protein [Pyrinomonadaceae bacterium]